MTLRGVIRTAHDWVANCLSNGATAVDATAGNGHDTVFLAKRVGPNGKVLAFDIQETALNITREKLVTEQLNSRVRLIQDTHVNANLYLDEEEIQGAIFNLGYLPGGDEAIVTKVDSTLEAIDQLANALAPKGIMAIVVYPGHQEGAHEARALEAHLKSYDSEKWRIMKYEWLNTDKHPPYLLGLEKRKRC